MILDKLEKELNISTLMKIVFKPEYSNIFNKITNINAPVKNDIIITLLDGKYHSQTEIIRLIKKKHQYLGPITLTTMVESLNSHTKNNYVVKKKVNGRIYYKISDNYVGLTKAAFTKFRFANI